MLHSPNTELNKTIDQALNSDPWFDRKQAARYCNLSPSALANYASMGKGPPYVRPGGGRVRYRRSDLDRWMRDSVTNRYLPKDKEGAK